MGSINKGPRRKRCVRDQRLTLGALWIKKYQGNNLIKGYAKHFGVNKPCAIKELEMLGVEIAVERKNEILNAYNRMLEDRKKKKAARAKACMPEIASHDTFAYIIGYTSGGAPYGVTWAEEKGCKTPDKSYWNKSVEQK